MVFSMVRQENVSLLVILQQQASIIFLGMIKLIELALQNVQHYQLQLLVKVLQVYAFKNAQTLINTEIH
jgi:hypothetical protein